MEDIQGRIVSEEEVAGQLGFANVFEFRRWQTDIGNKLSEAERALYNSKQDAETFRWHGRRMQAVLEMIDDHLQNGTAVENKDRILLAIGVVCGSAVDWDHVLDRSWFEGNHENTTSATPDF